MPGPGTAAYLCDEGLRGVNPGHMVRRNHAKMQNELDSGELLKQQQRKYGMSSNLWEVLEYKGPM